MHPNYERNKLKIQLNKNMNRDVSIGVNVEVGESIFSFAVFWDSSTIILWLIKDGVGGCWFCSEVF